MYRKLNGRRLRVARSHMADYTKVMKKPISGVITYGGGLNIPAWIRAAEGEGFHATMTPTGVELRIK